MKLHSLTFILLIIGGLNWLLVVLGVDIGTWVSASWWMTLMKVIYILVGLSALYELFTHKKRCKECMMKSGGTSAGMGGQSM
jgi:uncharacterized membrane protein YuzA (DUF378 family)